MRIGTGLLGLMTFGAALGQEAPEAKIVDAPPEVARESSQARKLPRELKAEPVPTPTPAAQQTAGPSATSTEPRSPDEMVAEFFESIEAEEVEAAYDGLTAGTVVAGRPEEAARLRAQTQSALDAYGPTHGFALVEREQVGDFLERRTYLLRGEVLPLRWKFYFYDAKGSGDWKLVDLRVDDDLVATVDENAKVAE